MPIQLNKARIVFWAGVVVFVGVPWLSGTVKIARGFVTKPALAAVEKAPPAVDSPAAAATAAAFATEYLTFDPADYLTLSARMDRLRHYMAGSDGYAGLIPAKETKPQAVISTWVHGYRDASADGNRATFLVQALVAPKGGQARTVYLAVPVATDGAGQWVVPTLPHFTAGPGLAQVSAQEEGEALPDPDGAVRALLQGFLKAYLTGTPAEISVYMAPGAPAPKGLADSMHVQLREPAEVHLTQDGAGARAEISAVLVDQDSGAGLKQTFRLALSQVNGRWAVAHLD